MRRPAQFEIVHPSPGLRVYPDPEDVFVADQPELARHLHPLVSIDLAQVDDDWQGWIHLVSPLEPHEVTLGYATKPFHSPLQRENWLGFTIEGDRYRLLGDMRYFARVTTPEELPDPWPGFRQELDAHCEAEERSYQEYRDAFQRTGAVPATILDQLGGDAEEGNWHTVGYEDPNFRVEDDEDGIWPISPSGNRFRFVAEVPGWKFRRSGADGILLFFEPVDRLALLTFDWT